MKQTARMMLALLGAAVCGVPLADGIKENITAERLKMLYALSSHHDMAHLVGYSLEAAAITSGRLLRRCAFAAMVTGVSVMPHASFARVLPVAGAMMSASKGYFGPSGSAPTIERIGSRPQREVRVEISACACPKRVSETAEVYERMGKTSRPASMSA